MQSGLIEMLWVMGYGLWAMGYGLWAMGYGIWDMGYGIKVTHILYLISHNS